MSAPSGITGQSYNIGSDAVTATYDPFTLSIDECDVTYSMTITPSLPSDDSSAILEDLFSRSLWFYSVLITSAGSYHVYIVADYQGTE